MPILYNLCIYCTVRINWLNSKLSYWSVFYEKKINSQFFYGLSNSLLENIYKKKFITEKFSSKCNQIDDIKLRHYSNAPLFLCLYSTKLMAVLNICYIPSVCYRVLYTYIHVHTYPSTYSKYVAIARSKETRPRRNATPNRQKQPLRCRKLEVKVGGVRGHFCASRNRRAHLINHPQGIRPGL